jgi:hypothetical protein
MICDELRDTFRIASLSTWFVICDEGCCIWVWESIDGTLRSESFRVISLRRRIISRLIKADGFSWEVSGRDHTSDGNNPRSAAVLVTFLAQFSVFLWIITETLPMGDNLRTVGESLHRAESENGQSLWRILVLELVSETSPSCSSSWLNSWQTLSVMIVVQLWVRTQRFHAISWSRNDEKSCVMKPNNPWCSQPTAVLFGLF